MLNDLTAIKGKEKKEETERLLQRQLREVTRSSHIISIGALAILAYWAWNHNLGQ